MLSSYTQGESNFCLLNENSERDSIKNMGMDENDAEQMCEALFMLIPEVSRLKELFLCWSLLNEEERTVLDNQVTNRVPAECIHFYKHLKEALSRWELIQDTQGAPGCEPGSVSFSCDPQLEEELLNVIITLETLLQNLHSRSHIVKKTIDYPMVEEIQHILSQKICRKTYSKGRNTLPHSVQSCCFPLKKRYSTEDISGYKTD